MSKVIGPFMSAWASGSVGNCLTCRPRKDGSFVMAEFYPMKHARVPNQDIGKNHLMWTMARAKLFLKSYPNRPRHTLEPTP